MRHTVFRNSIDEDRDFYIHDVGRFFLHMNVMTAPLGGILERNLISAPLPRAFVAPNFRIR